MEGARAPSRQTSPAIVHDIWHDRRGPIGPLLIVPKGKFDIADPKPGARPKRLTRARSHHGTVDRSAIG